MFELCNKNEIYSISLSKIFFLVFIIRFIINSAFKNMWSMTRGTSSIIRRTMKDKLTKQLSTMNGKTIKSWSIKNDKTTKSWTMMIGQTIREQQQNGDRKKGILYSLFVSQIIWICLTVFREVMREAGDTIILTGKKEKDIILKYFEPSETTCSIKGLEDGFDALKHIKEATLIICSPLPNGETNYKSSNTYYYYFSLFCQLFKLESLLNELKPINRATLLICIPSNTGSSSGYVKWVLDNEKLISMYTQRLFVFTDCNCSCKRQIPEEIQHISTGNPILHGLDGKAIGFPLIFLKHYGNLRYTELVVHWMYFFLDIGCGWTYRDFIKAFVKTRFPFLKWMR